MLHYTLKIFLISGFYLYYVSGAAIDLFEDPYFEDIPLCNTHKEACDISLTVNGVPISSAQQACRCRGQTRCSRGEDPTRTVTRTLSTRGQSLMMRLSYCDPLGNERVCVGDEVALVLEGGGVIPTKLVTSHCRCPAGRPMLLHRTFYPPNRWMIHNEFVCAKGVCPANTPNNPTRCKTSTRHSTRFGVKYSTTFNCQCPRGHSCMMEYNSTARRNHGYCQRV